MDRYWPFGYSTAGCPACNYTGISLRYCSSCPCKECMGKAKHNDHWWNCDECQGKDKKGKN